MIVKIELRLNKIKRRYFTMDYKALVAELYDLFKAFLSLIGLLDKFENVEGEVEDILGA